MGESPREVANLRRESCPQRRNTNCQLAIAGQPLFLNRAPRRKLLAVKRMRRYQFRRFAQALTALESSLDYSWAPTRCNENAFCASGAGVQPTIRVGRLDVLQSR